MLDNASAEPARNTRFVVSTPSTGNGDDRHRVWLSTTQLKSNIRLCHSICWAISRLTGARWTRNMQKKESQQHESVLQWDIWWGWDYQYSFPSRKHILCIFQWSWSEAAIYQSVVEKTQIFLKIINIIHPSIKSIQKPIINLDATNHQFKYFITIIYNYLNKPDLNVKTWFKK